MAQLIAINMKYAPPFAARTSTAISLYGRTPRPGHAEWIAQPVQGRA